jgi:stage III sporulation protein AF
MFNGHHYSEQRHNDGEVKKLQALTAWITNIVLFILLATIINLLLPNSSFQKYTKLVVGLLLMLIIITPVFKVDVNQMLKSLSLSSIRSDQQVENSIENQKKEIQASQRAYILEQMAVQMEADVKEELMDQYGVAIDRIHIETKKPNDEPTADNIKSISVAVSEKASNDSEVVSAVKVISIDTSTPIETNKPTESKKVSNYLAAKWDVKQGQVVVNMEEGDTK